MSDLDINDSASDATTCCSGGFRAVKLALYSVLALGTVAAVAVNTSPAAAGLAAKIMPAWVMGGAECPEAKLGQSCCTMTSGSCSQCTDQACVEQEIDGDTHEADTVSALLPPIESP